MSLLVVAAGETDLELRVGCALVRDELDLNGLHGGDREHSLGDAGAQPTQQPRTRGQVALVGRPRIYGVYIEPKLFFFLFFWGGIFGIFFFASAAPQRPTCAVIMPTLLAPQQGATCPCRLERCRIRTRDGRFHSLVHYHWWLNEPKLTQVEM